MKKNDIIFLRFVLDVCFFLFRSVFCSWDLCLVFTIAIYMFLCSPFAFIFFVSLYLPRSLTFSHYKWICNMFSAWSKPYILSQRTDVKRFHQPFSSMRLSLSLSPSHYIYRQFVFSILLKVFFSFYCVFPPFVSLFC